MNYDHVTISTSGSLQEVTVKARFHYERGKEHSLSLLLIFD